MLEEELGRMNPDMTAIAAFQAKEAEYTQRVSDLEAATAERDNVSPPTMPTALSPYMHIGGKCCMITNCFMLTFASVSIAEKQQSM